MDSLQDIMKSQTLILICLLMLTQTETTQAEDILLLSSSSEAQSDTRRALWLYGASFDIAGPEEMNRMDFNLYEYKVIVVSDDWNDTLTELIRRHRIGLESFAKRGGVVVYLFSGDPSHEKKYTTTWQAISLQLRRVSCNAQYPELGVIDPDHSKHPMVKRFANNYLGMSTHYGFENPSDKWQKIAYTESSSVPIILESNIGYGKMVTVSISNLTKYYLQKFHYSTLFRNIINYSLDYSGGQEERKKEFFD